MCIRVHSTQITEETEQKHKTPNITGSAGSDSESRRIFKISESKNWTY
jgi:hypothetical protein